MVTTHIWLLVSMAMRSSESSSHWQSPRMPAKSLTSRGGLGRSGTCAMAASAVTHSNSATVVSRRALFHIAIVFVMGIFCFIGIVKVVIGDLVAQFVLVVAFAGEVL